MTSRQTGGKYNSSNAEIKSVKINLNNCKEAQETMFRPESDEETGNWAVLHNIIHSLILCNTAQFPFVH
jgi:hypothetical protein